MHPVSEHLFQKHALGVSLRLHVRLCIELERGGHVCLAQELLNRFRIELHLHESRSQGMAKVVKPEAYLLSVLNDSCLHRGWTKILLNEDRSRQWLPALQRSAGEDESAVSGVGGFFPPCQQEASQQRMHGNRSL